MTLHVRARVRNRQLVITDAVLVDLPEGTEVDLVAELPERAGTGPRRTFGSMAGQITLAADFEDPLEDFAE